ncbi:NAD(P)H-dependent flavin oxidoreductase [Oceanobacillus salinisoli]|uniref:NAD(P)H-dependent flavin oxidoreductase n=1 Tax=Oceanobacillus salinisoli TaxID=2678611 RepID=UPI0012E2CBF5|nr:nitronate monooxygenase [Oceanobacillus salinisoli]
MLQNKITELFNIQYPIIQAPMAGGVTTKELVSAVSNNGALGMIGAGYMSPKNLRTLIKEVKQLTDRPFGVNLFVPNQFQVSDEKVMTAEQLLKPIRNELSIDENNSSELPDQKIAFQTYEEQLNIIIEEKIPICSFTFGVPSQEIIHELKQHGIIVVGTATTVKEAQEIENRGMDVIVAQGSEAGGHRGNFMNTTEEGLIGTMSLIPQVADAVNIPVIAAGGIMDGRGLMASVFLGAKAVQMGTAFLTCTESGAHPLHKQAILQASEDEMTLTRAFSGKTARGLNNSFMKHMKEHESSLPEFPVQNHLTNRIRKAAALQNQQEYMSLWSGQSPRLAKHQTVKELINRVMEGVI